MDVAIAGREVRLTSLERVVYPAAGFTKRDVLAYYAEAAPFLLPHLAGRAVEVRRYPDGVGKPGFWARDLPPADQRPSWLKAARVWAATRGGDIEYPHVTDAASLLWLANTNALELHVFLARFERPHEPTSLVFDLDPGPGRDIIDCADVALVIRDTLEPEGLRLFPKTSGGKGLQLFAPLNTPGITFSATKRVARQLAEAFALLQPERATASVRKDARVGKVLIDWGQNERNHLMVAPYSLRARERPSVSMPLAWREVEQLADTGDASLARFEPWDALARMREKGDLFAPVLTMRQRLPL